MLAKTDHTLMHAMHARHACHTLATVIPHLESRVTRAEALLINAAPRTKELGLDGGSRSPIVEM